MPRAVVDSTASDAWLSLHVGSCGADRVRVRRSVTFVTLHTPHEVARGIRATECEHRFPRRRPHSFVLTAFASLLGTRRRGPHVFRRLAVAERLILRCRSSARSWLACVSFVTLHTPH